MLRRKNRAFSLIEVLMAITVLAVTFLALIQVFPSAYLTVYRSKDQLVALQLAQSYMDETRAMPYTAMPEKTQSFNVPVESIMNDVSSTVTFNVQVQATGFKVPEGKTPVALDDSDMAQIRVVVGWNQKSSSGYTLQRSVRAESTRLRDI